MIIIIFLKNSLVLYFQCLCDFRIVVGFYLNIKIKSFPLGAISQIHRENYRSPVAFTNVNENISCFYQTLYTWERKKKVPRRPSDSIYKIPYKFENNHRNGHIYLLKHIVKRSKSNDWQTFRKLKYFVFEIDVRVIWKNVDRSKMNILH